MKVVLLIMELVRLSLSSVRSSCSFDAKDRKRQPDTNHSFTVMLRGYLEALVLSGGKAYFK